jgi:hypothetical protein
MTTSDDLDRLVGTWRMSSSLAPPGVEPPRAETSFEWLGDRAFLVQRWQVDHPAAPDGIALIGYDEERGAWLQHYFDSRGVARIYELSLEQGVWRLWRDHPGFSQRWRGTFDEVGDTISGSWETSRDGTTWEHDFELVYQRTSR